MAHRADVNAVCFVDDNTNVLASGADDGIVKVTRTPCLPVILYVMPLGLGPPIPPRD